MTTILPAQCRSARGFLDWTRADLAKASGVSVETVKNFEHGTFTPNDASRTAIIAAFEAQGVGFTEGGVKRKPSLAPDMMEALRTVLKYASPEEGQMWQIKFLISEDLYGKWKRLANG